MPAGIGHLQRRRRARRERGVDGGALHGEAVLEAQTGVGARGDEERLERSVPIRVEADTLIVQLRLLLLVRLVVLRARVAAERRPVAAAADGEELDKAELRHSGRGFIGYEEKMNEDDEDEDEMEDLRRFPPGAVRLQPLIDATPTGGTLRLEAKVYAAPGRITRPMRIEGVPGTIVDGGRTRRDAPAGRHGRLPRRWRHHQVGRRAGGRHRRKTHPQ